MMFLRVFTMNNRPLFLYFVLVLSSYSVLTREIKIDIDDNILWKICRLKFCANSFENCDFGFCWEKMMQESKYGQCPTLEGDTNICYNDCDEKDFRCGGIQKCCAIGCSNKCMNATKLEEIQITSLPMIPSEVEVKSLEDQERKTVQVTWKMLYHNRDAIEYIIECRVHVGYTFAEYKLSEWFVVQPYNLQQSIVRQQLEINIRMKLKIGRWYRIRIASVNANGTRGYSQPSQPFRLNERPNSLPNPTVFKIAKGPQLLSNHSVYTKFSWTSPTSEYPIDKYELSWSFYIQEGNGSLFMEKATIPEHKHSYELSNLLSDSLYYLQLNAVSLYGNKRLKSGKVWLFLNTTNLIS